MLKATGAGAGIFGVVNNTAVALFDVSLTVVSMAAAGAMISFAYGNDDTDKPIPRTKMYLLAFVNTVLACALTSILPDYMGWDWYSTKLEGSFALLLAAALRFIIPMGIKLVPELLGEAARKWLKLGNYNTTKQEEDEMPPIKDMEDTEDYEETDPGAAAVRKVKRSKSRGH